MDTNDLFVYGGDISDSLVNELNRSYDESLNEREAIASTDEALTRRLDQFTKSARPESETSSSLSNSWQKSATSPGDCAIEERSEDDVTLPRPHHPERHISMVQKQPLQRPEQHHSSQQPGYSSNSRLRQDSRTMRSVGSRGSPGTTEIDPEALPRLSISKSFHDLSPPEATYMGREPILSGFRPENRSTTLPNQTASSVYSKEEQANAIQPQILRVPKAGRSNLRRPRQPQLQEPQKPQEPQEPQGKYPLSDTYGSGRSSTNHSMGSTSQLGPRIEAGQYRNDSAAAQPRNATENAQSQTTLSPHQSEPKSSYLSDGQNAKDSSRHSGDLMIPETTVRNDDGTGGGLGLLMMILMVCIAVVLAFLFHRQGLRVQEATETLENKVTQLLELLESYASQERNFQERMVSVSVPSPVSSSFLRDHNHQSVSNIESVVDSESRKKSPRNLALLSEGAHILNGYTTPPASSIWWRLSQNFHADHNCMLRAPSAECWPIHNDATVAIGLGHVADLQEVMFHFAGVSGPFNFNAYSILATGDICSIDHAVSERGFDLIDATNITQILLRLSGFGDLCIRSVEVIGTSVQRSQ